MCGVNGVVTELLVMCCVADKQGVEEKTFAKAVTAVVIAAATDSCLGCLGRQSWVPEVDFQGRRACH